MLPAEPKTSASTVIIEWVVGAGQRLWIVRITQEQAVGVTNLVPAHPFLAQLSSLKLSSATLAHRSTVNVARLALLPNTSFSSLDQSPSWWGSSTCDSAWYNSRPEIQGFGSNYYAQRLGIASYHAVIACKPRPAYDFPSTCGPQHTGYCYTDESRNFGVGGVQVNEWECVELSLRYLYMAYHQSPYGGDGKDIVNNYPGSLLVPINNGAVGQAPVPGDVLSYAYQVHGHTPLVIASTVDNHGTSGNGQITVLEQNGMHTGTDTLNVSNWHVTTTWGATVTNWLHDPTSGGGSGGLTPTVSNQDVFVTGSNGHLYEYWQTIGSTTWGYNDLLTGAQASGLASNLTVLSSPTSYSYILSGDISGGTRHSVHVVLSDGNLYEFGWKSSTPGTWQAWNHSAPSGTSINNSSANGYGY